MSILQAVLVTRSGSDKPSTGLETWEALHKWHLWVSVLATEWQRRGQSWRGRERDKKMEIGELSLTEWKIQGHREHGGRMASLGAWRAWGLRELSRKAEPTLGALSSLLNWLGCKHVSSPATRRSLAPEHEVSWELPLSCLPRTDSKKWSYSFLSLWQLCLIAQLRGLWGALFINNAGCNEF